MHTCLCAHTWNRTCAGRTELCYRSCSVVPSCPCLFQSPLSGFLCQLRTHMRVSIHVRVSKHLSTNPCTFTHAHINPHPHTHTHTSSVSSCLPTATGLVACMAPPLAWHQMQAMMRGSCAADWGHGGESHPLHITQIQIALCSCPVNVRGSPASLSACIVCV